MKFRFPSPTSDSNKSSRLPVSPAVRRVVRRACFAVAAVLGLVGILVTAYPPPAPWVEQFYARGAFKLIAPWLIWFHSAVPFSLTATLIVVALAWLLAFSAWRWQTLRGRGASIGLRLFELSKWVVVAGVLVYSLFLIAWGANYHRQSLEDRLGLAMWHGSEQDVELLRLELLQFIAENRPAESERDVARAIRSASASMGELVKSWDGTAAALPDRVKVVPGGLLLRLSVLGVCSPFLVEPHVDGKLPPMPFMRVAAHELAHVAGINGEAEADFVSWVAGIRADDPYMRYATAIHLYVTLAQPLPAERQAAVLRALPEDAIHEWTEYRSRLIAYRSPLLMSFSRPAYHTYLKSQGVKAGIGDYSRGASLFLSAWSQNAVPLPVGLEFGGIVPALHTEGNLADAEHDSVS